jgi:hypothetical protein
MAPTLKERFTARLQHFSYFSFMQHRPDPPSTGSLHDPAEENNQARVNPEEPHPDAFGAVAQPTGYQGGIRGGVRAPTTTPADLDLAALTQRDVAIIRRLVLLRVLTYDRSIASPSSPLIPRSRVAAFATLLAPDGSRPGKHRRCAVDIRATRFRVRAPFGPFSLHSQQMRPGHRLSNAWCRDPAGHSRSEVPRRSGWRTNAR